MIHTVYSNVYEVLRAVLLHNLEAENEAAFNGLFMRRPVLVPSIAVGDDLRRSIARETGVCAGYDFMPFSSWMGFFSREPLANIGGNEADWMIHRILAETGAGSFREMPGHERIAHYLKGKSEREVFELARRISGVFVTYASYRTDWLLAWMRGDDEGPEHKGLKAHPDYEWQRALWRRLCAAKDWQGRRYLENLPDTLVRLARAGDASSVALADGRVVELPKTLHIFVPFVVPPLMLPLLRAFARSGRDIWLYLLNPCSEYWFDLLPRRLIEVPGNAEHRESGHVLLADNARSVRANIDRLWRFTAESKVDVGLHADVNAEAVVEELSAYRGDLSSEDVVGLDHKAPLEPLVRRGLKAEMRAVARMRPQDVEVGVETDLQSYYLETNRSTLLHRIQDSVLNLDPGRAAADEEGVWLAPNDRSVQFFAAPSPVREWEALAEWLQHLFQTMPELAPDDVLIVTPDPVGAAPLIEQVFGSLPEGRRIPWKLAGIPRTQQASPDEALRRLVALMNGRAKLEELEGWWSLPSVSERWHFDADALSNLSAWLRDAGCRYGLSDAHLEAIDAETFATVRDMTLSRALERLALGLLRPEGCMKVWKDLVPVDGRRSSFTTTSDAPALLERIARLAALLEAFRLRIRNASGEPRRAPPSEWRRWIEDALETFFVPGDEWNIVRSTAEALAEDIEHAADRTNVRGMASEVTFELFMTALDGLLEANAGVAQAGNVVTITGMQAMRGLPYKVVAVAGLSEDCAFPGASKREEFDLMTVVPRRGDRDARQDNRNVFLDLLLAAREVFAVSYVAGSKQGAAEKKPSIVGEELRNWILDFAPDIAMRRQGEAQLTVRIPLTAASKTNFLSTAPWRSTDKTMLDAVRRAQAAGHREAFEPFADAGVPSSAGWVQVREVNGTLAAVVPFEVVMKFWRQPSKTTLACWGVRLPDEQDHEAEAGLMPAGDGLSVWERRSEAAELLLGGVTRDELEAYWSSDPRLGAEGIRDWSWQDDMEVAAALVRAVKAELSDWVRTTPRTADVLLDGLVWRDEEVGELPVVLRVNVSDVWEKTDEMGTRHRRRVFTTPSQISDFRSAYFQAFVHAAFVAAGESLETVVIGQGKLEKKNGKSGKSTDQRVHEDAGIVILTERFTWRDQQGAKALMRELVRAVLDAHASTGWLLKAEKEVKLDADPSDRLLLTGKSAEEASVLVERTKALKAFLEALWKYHDEFDRTMLEAWCRNTWNDGREDATQGDIHERTP